MPRLSTQLSPMRGFVVGQDKAAQRVAKMVNRKIDHAYVVIGRNIKQNAKKSIGKGSKKKPHSEPGKPIKSRTRIMWQTISVDYDKLTKKLVVGPKKINWRPGPDGARPVGKTVPQLLEYGGTIYSPRPTFIPSAFADYRAVNVQWKKARKERRDRGGGKYLKRDFKWVVIKKGVRKVDPRPTMRIAFNKSLTVPNLRKRFRAVGVPDSASLRKII